MPSLRSLILLLPSPLSYLPLAAANLRLTNLEASLPPLPALTLAPQASGFAFDLYSALPPASSTLLELTGLPDACSQYVGPGNECTTNMTATNIQFEDCGNGFTVCRCGDATMSMDTVRDRFGRVPVGLRRYVGNVVVLNDTEPHAVTLVTGDIHFFGDCAMDTWIHESTHSFDFANDTPHSSDPAWAQAIADDSCVPDNYSLTNHIEDFAQMSVIKTFMLLYNGHLPPGFQEGCMSHQLEYLSSIPLYNASALFGNTCNIDDGLNGSRHDTPPGTLDPSRRFSTLPFTFLDAPTPSLPRPSIVALHNHALVTARKVRPAKLMLAVLFLGAALV